MNCRMCGQKSVVAKEFPHLCSVCLASVMAEPVAVDDYATLREELMAAFDQASGGKGKVRHANALPFEDQPILAITRLLKGHPCGALAYQAIKKIIESGRLLNLKGVDAAVAEVHGAINYTAAMAIFYRELAAEKNGGQQ